MRACLRVQAPFGGQKRLPEEGVIAQNFTRSRSFKGVVVCAMAPRQENRMPVDLRGNHRAGSWTPQSPEAISSGVLSRGAIEKLAGEPDLLALWR